MSIGLIWLQLLIFSFVFTIDVKCSIKEPKNAWYLGEATLSALAQASGNNCNRRGAKSCPNPGISFQLFTPQNPSNQQMMDSENDEWLRESDWQSNLETMIMFHGYAGGPETVPIAILKDAYLRSQKFNVIMVDWIALSRPPCYLNAIQNMDIVGRCTAMVVEQMQRVGDQNHLISCTGHSLGAHICGFIANYLTIPMHRIIGLDSAKPYVKMHPSQHLDASDANSVQMIITNGGGYGMPGGYGHLDICINGGKMQPYCRRESNEGLCSHVWAVCYLAESLFAPKVAMPCASKCPNRPTMLPGEPMLIGNAAPTTATGTYCVYDNHPPFCPITEDDIGDTRCCMRRRRHHSLVMGNSTDI